MKAKASCPAYATGIFVIGKGDAAGAGFALDLHLVTSAAEKASGSTSISINGKKSAAPVSKAVIRRFSYILEEGIGKLEIHHHAQAPVGFGLGMSAAGALSLSLALNELFGAGLSRQECVKIAHDSEVECGTGLSGVDAAAIGGFLARRSLSSAPLQLPFEERKIALAFFSPIKTAQVIRSPDWKGRVNRAGRKALGQLFSQKTWDSFINSSRYFALSSGLASWCKPELEKNARASMAMLGRTLFSDAPLRLSAKPIKLIKTRTYPSGARLL
ncbi:MAG: hypothetical protein N3G22_01745 [Candidatus Micrarchaeota archaeon]|nr:hypothetical protein [Candidatus Micrarchaeota archaeon]